jgi:NAD(P)H dehydrogenase (quinone)
MVLIAHPRPGSFNHALAAVAAERLIEDGYEVSLHDLYVEGFHPVITAEETRTYGADAEQVVAATGDALVRRHRELIREATTLVVVHPNWWGKPPAILAGWLDRILVPGIAYRLDAAQGVPTCLLKLRRLVVLNTSDTPPQREAAVFGDPLEAIWTRCVGEYLGDAIVSRTVFAPLAGSTPAQRESWLARTATLVSTPT